MRTEQLTSTPGFALYDIDEAAGYAGEVRLGAKLIPGNATMLMRHQTYVFAALNIRKSGASVGLKSDAADADAAVAAVADELGDQLSSGQLNLSAGLRLNAELIEPLTALNPGTPLADDTVHELVGVGAAAAAAAVLGEVDGKRAAVAGFGPAGLAIAREFAAAGGSVARVSTPKGCADGSFGPEQLADAWHADGDACVATLAGDDEPAKPWMVWKGDVDVIFCGGAVGAISGDGAQMAGTTPVVGYSPAAVSSKALAIIRQAGGTAVGDFVSCIGPTLARETETDTSHDALRAQTAERVAELVAASLDHPDGPFMASCYAAEEFMRSWVDELPFGRPLG